VGGGVNREGGLLTFLINFHHLFLKTLLNTSGIKILKLRLITENYVYSLILFKILLTINENELN